MPGRARLVRRAVRRRRPGPLRHLSAAARSRSAPERGVWFARGALAAAGALAALGLVGLASSTDAAAAHFARGESLARAGDRAGALRALDRAVLRWPLSRTTLAANELIRRVARAETLRLLGHPLADPGSEPTPAPLPEVHRTVVESMHSPRGSITGRNLDDAAAVAYRRLLSEGGADARSAGDHGRARALNQRAREEATGAAAAPSWVQLELFDVEEGRCEGAAASLRRALALDPASVAQTYLALLQRRPNAPSDRPGPR